MVLSVVRSFNWSISEIDKLYVDEIDYHGLVFWYEDIKKNIPKTRS